MNRTNDLKHNKNKTLIKRLKWFISSIIIPIIVAYIASGYFRKDNIEIIYHEVPNIEKFNAIDYFPLKKGNFWIYECTSKSTDSTSIVRAYKYKYKTIVEDIVIRENYTLALMNNEFFDIEINEGNMKFSEQEFAYLIISNKIYLIDKDYIKNKDLNISKLDTTWYLMKDNYSAPNFFPELVFEFPLYDGQQFGRDLRSQLRDDFRYRPIVKKESSYLSKTENKIEEITVYKVIDATLGSDYYRIFMPYKGIIEESYEHHGTIDKFNHSLIETNVK